MQFTKTFGQKDARTLLLWGLRAVSCQIAVKSDATERSTRSRPVVMAVRG
ncbi:hypothetical protein BKA25_004380 [Actinoalloteichus hymeniacidonis]|uniref:Uncharacterized protein n=1 Tax=Actinoalloteichus hymeniacidonis TaxID=340345 RepID=A0AAC9HMJ3_9PSEU|nr:hypothetical protein TL08_05445 [Actinoalloteichus hymeniacidonis]MBB5910064.1 hypothetical protein [Actinoalloteichus hymeniacidonis]